MYVLLLYCGGVAPLLAFTYGFVGEEGQALLKCDDQDPDDSGRRGIHFYSGLNRPPYNATEAKADVEEWESSRGGGVGSRKTSKSTKSTGIACIRSRSCACVLIMFIVVSIVIAGAVGCVVGLFVGDRLGRMVDIAEPYDWGMKVVINGTSYNIPDVFSSKLNASDIRSYL